MNGIYVSVQNRDSDFGQKCIPFKETLKNWIKCFSVQFFNCVENISVQKNLMLEVYKSPKIEQNLFLSNFLKRDIKKDHCEGISISLSWFEIGFDELDRNDFCPISENLLIFYITFFLDGNVIPFKVFYLLMLNRYLDFLDGIVFRSKS